MNKLSERLNDILKMNLAKDYTSISYAIMQKGELVAAGALGTSGTKEKKPSTIQDTYNVASVSKIYCTLAVMKLVEQKKVELDCPIYQYLPRLYHFRIQRKRESRHQHLRHIEGRIKCLRVILHHMWNRCMSHN